MTTTLLRPGRKYVWRSMSGVQLVTFRERIRDGGRRENLFFVPSFRGLNGPRDPGLGSFSDRDVNTQIDALPIRWCHSCNELTQRHEFEGTADFCAKCADRVVAYGEAMRNGLEVMARIDPRECDRLCNLIIGEAR